MTDQSISQALPNNPTIAAGLRKRLLIGRNLWVVTIVGMLVFVVMFWLPFGFKTTGILDEWAIIHDWELGGKSEMGQDVGLFVTTGTLAMRPMDPATYIIAHEISPDSFLGFNLYLITTFVLKGLLLYAILRNLLPDNPLFALGVALLFIIFPADSGLFTFMGLNVHTAVCLYLFAVWLLLSYYEKPRLIKLVGIWVSLIVCLFAYESGHPLIAATPLLLLWKDRRLSKKLIRTAVLWWMAPLVAFTYAVMMFSRGETYEAWLLTRSGLNQTSVIGEIAQSIWMTYRRHFGDGWIPSLETFAPLLPYALGIAATTIALFAAHLPWASRLTAPGRRRYVELFLMGLVIILLAYIIYMLTPYRQLTWRVYYFSGIGGALCIASLVYIVSRWFNAWRGVFVAAMISLIMLAGVHALDQHRYFVGVAEKQQVLLRGVARAVPKLDTAATLVVVDETGRYRDNWSLGASYLMEGAVSYVYDDYTTNVLVCSFNPQEAQFVVLPELRELCAFDAAGLHKSEDGEVVTSIPYDKLVVVRFTDAGAELLPSLPAQYVGASVDAASAYNPTEYVDTSAAPPYRYNTMFTIAN